MKVKSTQKSSFTLIELIVVIGIIGILTGILLPAISASMMEGRKTKAAAAARQIAAAVDAYFHEYSSLPLPPSTTTDVTKEPVDSTLLQLLDGNNARKRSFLNSAGGIKDPWGDGFKISMDGNYDNQIKVTEDGKDKDVGGKVAVWTSRDGDTAGSWGN